MIFNERHVHRHRDPGRPRIRELAARDGRARGDVYVSQFTGGQFVVHHSTDGGKSFSHPDPTTAALYPFGVNNRHLPGPLSDEPVPPAERPGDRRRPDASGHVYVAEANQIDDARGTSGRGRHDLRPLHGLRRDLADHLPDRRHVLANVINDDNGGSSASGHRGRRGQRPGHAPAGGRRRRATWPSSGTTRAATRPTTCSTSSAASAPTAARRSAPTSASPTSRSTPTTASSPMRLGSDDFYLGDTIGLALANDAMYAAWTDTRQRQSGIFFSRCGIGPDSRAAQRPLRTQRLAGHGNPIGPDPVFDRSLPQLDAGCRRGRLVPDHAAHRAY